MKKAAGAIIHTGHAQPGPVLNCLGLALICFGLATLAACRKAEEPLSHKDIIRADLAEILELQGLACSEVVKFEVGGRLDYRIECRSGEQYRIHVSAEGHVKAEQHQE